MSTHPQANTTPVNTSYHHLTPPNTTITEHTTDVNRLLFHNRRIKTVVADDSDNTCRLVLLSPELSKKPLPLLSSPLLLMTTDLVLLGEQRTTCCPLKRNPYWLRPKARCVCAASWGRGGVGVLMGRWRIAQKVLYEVELTYEDFNFRQFESFGLVWFGGAAPPLIPPPTDEVLRKLLPENVEVPSSMEQVGHILHVNLGEEQLPQEGHRRGVIGCK